MNLYAYVGNNSINYADPTGLKVQVVSTDPKTVKILQNAYAKINGSEAGRNITKPLEDSSDTYKIKAEYQKAYYKRTEKTVYIDPYNDLSLPTSKGMQPAPTYIVLAHELGHANGAYDDGPNSMNNVIKNENPIRAENNLPLRTDYYVPDIRWTPNSNSTPKIQNQGSSTSGYKAAGLSGNYK